MQSSNNDHTLWQKSPQQAHAVTWNTAFDADHIMNSASNQPLPHNCTFSGYVDHKNDDKPIRRRSRVSKKTPTTFLNANPRNFRTLVQQFTGCNTTCYKGPVTINFERKSSFHSSNHRDSHRERSESVSFRTNYSNSTNVFTDDPTLFASAVALTKYVPGGGDLSRLENFDMEKFSRQDLLGPGDYSTPTWEAPAASTNDEYSDWNYI